MNGLFVGYSRRVVHGNHMEEESAWSTTSVIGLNKESRGRVPEIRLRGQMNEELLRRDWKPMSVTRRGRKCLPTMISGCFVSCPTCSSQGSPLFTTMLLMSVLSYFVGMIKGVNPVIRVRVLLRIESSSLQLLDFIGNSLWSGRVITAGGLLSLPCSHYEETEFADNDLSGFFWK